MGARTTRIAGTRITISGSQVVEQGLERHLGSVGYLFLPGSIRLLFLAETDSFKSRTYSGAYYLEVFPPFHPENMRDQSLFAPPVVALFAWFVAQVPLALEARLISGFMFPLLPCGSPFLFFPATI